MPVVLLLRRVFHFHLASEPWILLSKILQHTCCKCVTGLSQHFRGVQMQLLSTASKLANIIMFKKFFFTFNADSISPEEMEAWVASLQDGKGEAPEEFGAVVKKKMTPQALLPFEWDRQKPKAEFVSKEEDKKRLERRMKNKIC